MAIDVSFAMMSGCVFDVSADLYSVRLSASHQMTAIEKWIMSVICPRSRCSRIASNPSPTVVVTDALCSILIRYYQVFLCAFVPVRAPAPGALRAPGSKNRPISWPDVVKGD